MSSVPLVAEAAWVALPHEAAAALRGAGRAHSETAGRALDDRPILAASCTPNVPPDGQGVWEDAAVGGAVIRRAALGAEPGTSPLLLGRSGHKTLELLPAPYRHPRQVNPPPAADNFHPRRVAVR